MAELSLFFPDFDGLEVLEDDALDELLAIPESEGDRRPIGRIVDEPWSSLFELALEKCRADEWEIGLRLFTRLYREVRREDLPGLFYSYLGYGAAKCSGEIARGVRLCRRAVEMEFYQPDNYLNLARILVLVGDRRRAVAAVESGLLVDESHAELLDLRADLGARRQPTVGFLSRRSPVNKVLGRLRHDLTR